MSDKATLAVILRNVRELSDDALLRVAGAVSDVTLAERVKRHLEATP